jgi:hypothetical protein
MLLDDPRFAAHRVLDRLGALALEVHNGVPGASGAFVDAVREIVRGASWLLDVVNQADAYRQGPHSAPSAPGDVPALSDDGLIDDAGVSTLLAVAFGVAGADGAKVVIGLAAAAMAAERWVPGLTRAGDTGHVVDVALLGGAPVTTVREWLRPFLLTGPVGLSGPTESHGQLPAGSLGGAARGQPWGAGADQVTPVMIDQRHPWLMQSTSSLSSSSIAKRIMCLKLLHELLDSAVPAPEHDGPVTWTTGIESVEVTDPCGASPSLTIHGRGFGATAPPGVGVVAAAWDQATAAVIYRPVKIVSWSDTQVVVQLGPNALGGTVAFADVAWIAIYDDWAKSENERVAAAMHQAGCPGYGPPAKPQIWARWSEAPVPVPAATYQAGAPRIVVDLAPVGRAPVPWSSDSVHLETGEAFRVSWRTANADTAALRADAAGQQMLVAAGHPQGEIIGASGSVLLVAPSTPAVASFTVEARNACGTVQVPLRVVVTGPALQPSTITVLQSLPGGDVDVHVVLPGVGGEMLLPPSAVPRSIPLVAEKRTVARIDWWTAVPQAPPGEQLTAHALVELSGPATWPSSVTLRPGSSTADPPPTWSVELKSGPPFSSVLQYQQWVAAGNNPATFNVVLPPELCKGEVTLKAIVQARSPGGLSWTATASTTVRFHQRRRKLIRYRPWQWSPGLQNPPDNEATQGGRRPGQPAPSDEECQTALRAAASLLPIPDPQIIRIPGPPGERGSSKGLVEELWAMRPKPVNEDEIWFSVAPAGRFGVFIGTMPWTGETDLTPAVGAHEAGHMFGQNHVRLCGAAQNPEEPSAFPDQGNIVVIGWDLWNNRPVRGGIDLMSYCWGQAWISPERWRRIFLQARP